MGTLYLRDIFQVDIQTYRDIACLDQTILIISLILVVRQKYKFIGTAFSF